MFYIIAYISQSCRTISFYDMWYCHYRHFGARGSFLPTPVHGKMAHKPSVAHSRARESQQMTPVHRFHLSCSEDSVTGITKSWEDIVLIVQTFVKGCKIDIHIRMHFLNGFDALR